MFRKLLTQFAKFGIVGIIAFLIDYGTMLALTELFGVPYLISTTAGFVVSVIFNYFASMKYVFARRDDLSRGREFAIFVILSVIGLILNDVLMFASVDLLGGDYRFMKLLVTAIVMVYNFISRKVFLEHHDKPTTASQQSPEKPESSKNKKQS